MMIIYLTTQRMVLLLITRFDSNIRVWYLQTGGSFLKIIFWSSCHAEACVNQCLLIILDNVKSMYRVYPSNKQKQNWKIDTSLVAIGAQNLFFSLYKLGVNFLWIREILKMYISPSFSNRKKVQYYRFCIFKGVSKLDLLHSTGHKSLKNGSKSNNLGSLIKFRKFLAR